MEDESSGYPSGSEAVATALETEDCMVVRSPVPDVRDYQDYKEYLRHDFFASCAYCTMSEAEAQAHRFEIDHYEPVSMRPDLGRLYSNLMYSCDECNSRKGNLSPPPAARDAGLRFFRPDSDSRPHHFKGSGLRIEATTAVGEFSIDNLDLNRQALRRLRGLRERLADCEEHVSHGIMALRSFPLDRLPQDIKGRAARAINETARTNDQIGKGIDALLREHAKSPLVDPDLDAEARRDERKAKLKRQEGLFEGAWRGKKKKRN